MTPSCPRKRATRGSNSALRFWAPALWQRGIDAMIYLLPPLNPLRAFAAAARHLSFKLAAQEVHVTPGAVGQQVKALEDRLGVRLFERLRKQLNLTPAGQN